jgi:3-hydroxy acid dehydrogenase / malonic semialdehyde reductase
MNQKTALITGATAGIGYETAFLLAQNNYNLILTGRRKERLESVKNKLESAFSCKILLLNFDIRSKKATEAALNNIPEAWKAIDVLINNAGLAAGLGPVNSADVDDWDNMIDTNVKGLLYTSRIVTPWMVERQTGHVINITSIAGKEVYPNGSVYCGTKHAVAAITKAMRIELMPFGIKVSSIAPGAVETEFSLVRFRGDQNKADQVYKGFEPLTAKDIAETILFVLSRPAHVNINDLLIMPTNQASARDFNRK